MADDLLIEKLAEARAHQSLILHRLGEVEAKLREHAADLEAQRTGHAQALRALAQAHQEEKHAADVWRAKNEPDIATVREAKKGILDRVGGSIMWLAGGAGLATVLSEVVKAIKGGP